MKLIQPHLGEKLIQACKHCDYETFGAIIMEFEATMYYRNCLPFILAAKYGRIVMITTMMALDRDCILNKAKARNIAIRYGHLDVAEYIDGKLNAENIIRINNRIDSEKVELQGVLKTQKNQGVTL